MFNEIFISKFLDIFIRPFRLVRILHNNTNSVLQKFYTFEFITHSSSFLVAASVDPVPDGQCSFTSTSPRRAWVTVTVAWTYSNVYKLNPSNFSLVTVIGNKTLYVGNQLTVLTYRTLIILHVVCVSIVCSSLNQQFTDRDTLELKAVIHPELQRSRASLQMWTMSSRAPVSTADKESTTLIFEWKKQGFKMFEMHQCLMGINDTLNPKGYTIAKLKLNLNF